MDVSIEIVTLCEVLKLTESELAKEIGGLIRNHK